MRRSETTGPQRDAFLLVGRNAQRGIPTPQNLFELRRLASQVIGLAVELNDQHRLLVRRIAGRKVRFQDLHEPLVADLQRGWQDPGGNDLGNGQGGVLDPLEGSQRGPARYRDRHQVQYRTRHHPEDPFGSDCHAQQIDVVTFAQGDQPPIGERDVEREHVVKRDTVLDASRPPAFSAMLPPIVEIGVEAGSGAYTRPSREAAALRSALMTPGSTVARRARASISRIRFMPARSSISESSPGTIAAERFVAAPRLTIGMPRSAA